VDELAGDSSSNTMPWEASRLLGHRGSGKN